MAHARSSLCSQPGGSNSSHDVQHIFDPTSSQTVQAHLGREAVYTTLKQATERNRSGQIRPGTDLVSVWSICKHFFSGRHLYIGSLLMTSMQTHRSQLPGSSATHSVANLLAISRIACRSIGMSSAALAWTIVICNPRQACGTPFSLITSDAVVFCQYPLRPASPGAPACIGAAD